MASSSSPLVGWELNDVEVRAAVVCFVRFGPDIPKAVFALNVSIASPATQESRKCQRGNQ